MDYQGPFTEGLCESFNNSGANLYGTLTLEQNKDFFSKTNWGGTARKK